MRKKLLVGAVAVATLGGGFFITHAVSAASGINCDANAVITGGVSSGGGVQSAYNNGTSCTSGGTTYTSSASSIQKIFSCMSISKSDVANLAAGAVPGYVTSSGDVYANGKLVATGAMTGGRQNISGSTNRTAACGTPFFERRPSVSFQEAKLAALVDLNKDGVFQFAIINSCGNPVIATPVAQPKPKPQPQPTPTTPNYKISKAVALQGSTNYGSSISNVAPGTKVTYRITVQSTGTAAVTNLVVTDKPDSGVQYVDNSLKRDGVAVKNPQDNAFFTNTGVMVGTLAPGASTVFTFDAIIGPNDTQQNCTSRTLNNTGRMTATNLPPKSSSATVSEVCKPATPPVVNTTFISAEQPTALPNTGAGSAFGLFAAVSATAALAHRLYLARKVRDQ